MSSTIHVRAARIPDRDRLLRELGEHGLDARAVDEVGIEVPCAGDDVAQVSRRVFARVQETIMRIGAPFVPVQHDGVIYIRPPVS